MINNLIQAPLELFTAADVEPKEVRWLWYLSNDSRCYYYSGTDFILAEELLDKLDPETAKKVTSDNALALIKTY